MMMNRSHFENTLAMCKLEISNLNNIAHCFAYINNTNRKKKNRAFNTIAKSSNKAAKEKSEPVSPIKVLAGFQFQQRKPQTPPRRAPERIPKPANC